jgi:hypothetical protein
MGNKRLMMKTKILFLILFVSTVAQAQVRTPIQSWYDYYGKYRYFGQVAIPKLPPDAPDSNDLYFYDGHLHIWEGTWKEFSVDSGNNYVDSIRFDTTSGIFTLWRHGMDSLTTPLDGRYFKLSDTAAAFSKYFLKPVGGATGQVFTLNSSNEITLITPTYLTRDSIINGAGVYNFHYPLYKINGANDVWIDTHVSAYSASDLQGVKINPAHPHLGDVLTYDDVQGWIGKPSNGGMVIGFTPGSSTDNSYPIGTTSIDDTNIYFRKSDGTWVKSTFVSF